MTTTEQLGQVFKISKGKKAAKVIDEPNAGTLPYIQIDEVRGTRPSKYVIDSKAVEVTEDDLCIVWDGANAGTVGYGVKGAIGSTVARMRLKQPEKWAPRFLGRLLGSKFQELNDQAQARGATIPHVDKAKLEEILFPKIHRDEQRRIAAILDKADAIRRKRQQALDFADGFLKSAYVHLVGPCNPAYAEWMPETIEKLAQDKKGAIRSGPFGSALLHSEFVDEGVAVLGIDNAVQNQFAWGQRRFITEEKYEELRRYQVFPGDVIITIMGTTGRSAVVPDDIPEAITTKHLASITCDSSKILPEVLSFAIHSDPMIIRQIKQHNKGAIMDGLNLGIIKKLVLPKPPMKLQQRFAAALRSVSKHKKQISAELGDGTELFASLSQRAFRGEL
ncbi:restriction endonuclease subunit S [Paenochrobactrum sp. BZR 201-1]